MSVLSLIEINGAIVKFFASFYDRKSTISHHYCKGVVSVKVRDSLILFFHLLICLSTLCLSVCLTI